MTTTTDRYSMFPRPQLPAPSEYETIYFEPTSEVELIDLARALLRDPLMHVTLVRVGINGDFTRDEEQALEAAIKHHGDARGWVRRDPRLLCVAVALARRIVEGAIDGIDSEQARAFVSDRYFSRSAEPGGSISKEGRGTIDEALMLAREIYQTPGYREIYTNPRPQGPELTEEERLFLHMIEFNFCTKHGLHCRGHFIVAYILLADIRLGLLKSLDGDAARSYAHQLPGMRKVDK